MSLLLSLQLAGIFRVVTLFYKKGAWQTLTAAPFGDVP